MLGPLVVSNDAGLISLGGYKQRALLAILLIDRNRVVATDRIIDRLWDGEPPPTAGGTLQSYLSHLRRALREPGTDRQPIATRAPGYVLVVGDDQVDADRFSQLSAAGAAALAGGDPAAAWELLDQALALHRGPPLADFESESFAREERTRLDELVQQVRENRMQAGLELGWHHRLVGELQGLVRREPLRERTRGQLMLALYRSGRQVEALDVYREGRNILADELGIDPGRDLKELHEAILRQDPSLAAPFIGVAPATPVPVGARRPAGPVERRAQAWRPPERSLPGAVPSNIGEALTPIVGRTTELQRITQLLQQGRLVSLTGAGGAGKTRLATEVCRQLAPTVDGPWMVELAGLDDPVLVPSAVARTLGVMVQGDRNPEELVADALGGRTALLLLDNCEHLLAAAADLAARLLAGCPGLRILATSREPLRLPGEQVFPVDPLPVGERTQEARLVDGDAMRLFEARAAAVLPGFTITAENRSVVRGICRELDGLPLAIELAAARMRVLAPEQLAEHLVDRFELLSGGSRNAQPRQRALRAAVEWSFNLLEDDERRLFTTLSVFSGGFELDAAARLWDGSPMEVLDLLDGLVGKSLVTADATASPRRYGMLQTLREYARQQLDPDLGKALALRHARWCAELTAVGETGLRGPDCLRWLRRLEAEHDNVRAAVVSALDAGHSELAARIVGPLGWYWFRRGHVDEARQWLERCDAVRGADRSEAWARVVMSLAIVRYFWGDVAQARRLADEAIVISRACDAAFAVTESTMYSAYFFAAVDLDEARRRAEDGLFLARQLGLPWVEAAAITTVGNMARARGDLDAAEALILQGVERAREAGYWWQERLSRSNAARVALDRGRPEVAVERLRGVVQDLTLAGDTTGVLLGLDTLAAAVARAQDPRLGAMLLGALATYSERVGFFPERVDPADGVRIREQIRRVLPGEDFEEAFERGRALSSGELAALVDRLAGV